MMISKKKPYFPYITRKCCFYWGMNVPKDVMKYIPIQDIYSGGNIYCFIECIMPPAPGSRYSAVGHREKGKFEP